MNIIHFLKNWAQNVRRDSMTLWFASRNPATPWYAKLIGTIVATYALSPIDLIPDFIPVFGYIDDEILLPCLIWITVKLLPRQVLMDSRSQAILLTQTAGFEPKSLAGAVLILLTWATVGEAIWMSID